MQICSSLIFKNIKLKIHYWVDTIWIFIKQNIFFIQHRCILFYFPFIPFIKSQVILRNTRFFVYYICFSFAGWFMSIEMSTNSIIIYNSVVARLKWHFTTKLNYYRKPCKSYIKYFKSPPIIIIQWWKICMHSLERKHTKCQMMSLLGFVYLLTLVR